MHSLLSAGASVPDSSLFCCFGILIEKSLGPLLLPVYLETGQKQLVLLPFAPF